MAPSTEIELKLALAKGHASKAKALIGRVRLERTAIEDVYFDTPGGDLRRRGLVLRLRRDGERWMQTLKSAPTQRNLVPVRGEWEVPLPAGRKVPALDLERFDIAPLRLLLRWGLDPASLAPVFRSRMKRHRGTILHGNSEVEVALDRGELCARVKGRRRHQPVAELEIELKSGRPEDVIALALDLVGRTRDATLVPAVLSKSERGYALSSDAAPPIASASARGFADQLRPEMDGAAALRAVIRHGLAIVVANADALRQAPAAEQVHQARVALRRMRSAIRLLDPEGHDLPAPLPDELRWLARALGRARDWDVIAEETLAVILSDAELTAGARRRLRRESARRRERARSRAVAALSSRRYARLVLQLARFTMSPCDGTEGNGSVPAARLLAQAAERLFRDANRFARLGASERHRVRIHAKRLRYALDLFATQLPERNASDYVDALASLQDALGGLNDASVAVEHLIRLARRPREKRALQDWLARAQSGLVAAASRQFKALARRPRPWAGRA